VNKRTRNIIIVGSIVIFAMVGLSFINYRKKKVARLSLLFQGVEEVGNNAGFSNDTFEKMMREVGWKNGEAWCSYFAKVVYLYALPNLSDDINKWWGGSSQATFQNVKNGKSDEFEVITSGRPKKGDIVIWQRINSPSQGHVGIVTKAYLNSSTRFDAIEGNTNYDPSFSGEGQLVDIVPHDTEIGKPDSQYPSLRLLGFIRLK
jgi:hypothetical protein